ncbi:hypothetical protein FOMPIDRAFT_1020044 [Fomitopsis schrenkii]|uniref:Uncharacterized protein n=1 Tax=Fomitopsis schrenkii TaxID=2126942 RepID=S8DLQ3_FOMSC|nr:hypothetical protein FOMPIDRAFT_1020044 [Fomitopsis schrenkii]
MQGRVSATILGAFKHARIEFADFSVKRNAIWQRLHPNAAFEELAAPSSATPTVHSGRPSDDPRVWCSYRWTNKYNMYAIRLSLTLSSVSVCRLCPSVQWYCTKNMIIGIDVDEAGNHDWQGNVLKLLVTIMSLADGRPQVQTNAEGDQQTHDRQAEGVLQGISTRTTNDKRKHSKDF